MEVALVVEVPRFGFVKRRADGTVDFVSPAPCPFNYGSVPGLVGGDGDPLDAVLLGPRVARGTVTRGRVVGVVWFTDEGAVDDKLVCVPVGAREPRWRPLVTGFFHVYALAKSLRAALRGRRGARFDGLGSARRGGEQA